MVYRLGFVMSQVAGLVTNYRNLRSVADVDSELACTWHEIYYHIEAGRIEHIRDHLLPFIPTYYSGIARATWEMHKALRTRPYDALLCNPNVAIFFTHVFREIPTLIDFDSTPLQLDRMVAYGSSNDHPAIAHLKWRGWQRVLESAALLQTWSHWAKESAITDYGISPDKIVVNPPGVDLHFWRPTGSRDHGGPQRILFVGGDFKRKGGQMLLDWYAGQNPAEYELHIVTREPVDSGPGVYVYHGLQPNTPQLRALYHQSDLFVLPSLGECFGLATVEAMAAGLPVIASDVGGVADIIEPGRNGYIIPSNEPSALGAAITAITADSGRRQIMGRQARLMAEERFDVQCNARRTLGYLKQIARPADVAQPAVVQ